MGNPIRKLASHFMSFGIRTRGTPMMKRLIEESKNVQAAQERVLKDILQYAGQTAYGKSHGFSSIQTAGEYAAAV